MAQSPRWILVVHTKKAMGDKFTLRQYNGPSGKGIYGVAYPATDAQKDALLDVVTKPLSLRSNDYEGALVRLDRLNAGDFKVLPNGLYLIQRDIDIQDTVEKIIAYHEDDVIWTNPKAMF